MKKSDREFIELMFAVCGDRLVASDSVSDALVRGAEAMYDHLTRWRPMKDAPKDGQWIEVVHEGVGVFPRQWDPVTEAWLVQAGCEFVRGHKLQMWRPIWKPLDKEDANG